MADEILTVDGKVADVSQIHCSGPNESFRLHCSRKDKLLPQRYAWKIGLSEAIDSLIVEKGTWKLH